MGRPIKPIMERKDFKVHTRLTEDEYITLKKKVNNVSKYLRKLIIRDLKKW